MKLVARRIQSSVLFTDAEQSLYNEGQEMASSVGTRLVHPAFIYHFG